MQKGMERQKGSTKPLQGSTSVAPIPPLRTPQKPFKAIEEPIRSDRMPSGDEGISGEQSAPIHGHHILDKSGEVDESSVMTDSSCSRNGRGPDGRGSLVRGGRSLDINDGPPGSQDRIPSTIP